MGSIEHLISELLNFGEDWLVEDFKVDHSQMVVDIYLRYGKSTGLFPGTSLEYSIYDFGKSRRVRHLDLFDYETYLNFKTPRVKNERSEVRNLEISWIDDRVSFSYKFESRVLECLMMSKNQSKTAEFFNSSFDVVHNIMVRGVARGLLRRDLKDITAISIDEKSFSNGHNYLSVLSDPLQKKVLDVIEGRKQENAEELLVWTLGYKALEKVTLATMDMWDPYIGAIKEVAPNARIIHDKFHIAKIVNKGVDNVRKAEVKTEEILKKTKYIFARNLETMSPNQKERFFAINQQNLRTSRAWKIKENFNGIYHLGTQKSCVEYFQEWYTDTINSDLKEMIKVADTILRHLQGVVNAAIHELSNGVAECINSQIQTVKSVARGFRNFNGYRNAVLFFQGKLNMTPL